MCMHCEEAFELLTKTFGKEHGEFLLWEWTCYPMSGDVCLRQAKKLVALKGDPRLNREPEEADLHLIS